MTLPFVPNGSRGDDGNGSNGGDPNRWRAEPGVASADQFDDPQNDQSRAQLGTQLGAQFGAQFGVQSESELAEDFDETPLVRSFLGRSLRPTAETDFDERSFRPFMVTGGRTTSDFPLDFEAMVTPTPAGLCADLRFEQRTIVDRCIQSGAQSIAELAAYLKLPIGTVRVVAADLVSSHMLDVHSPDKNLSNDVLMLKRLINGVRAL
jgi:Protein of unknown function (DUF742)